MFIHSKVVWSIKDNTQKFYGNQAIQYTRTLERYDWIVIASLPLRDIWQNFASGWAWKTAPVNNITNLLKVHSCHQNTLLCRYIDKILLALCIGRHFDTGWGHKTWSDQELRDMQADLVD